MMDLIIKQQGSALQIYSLEESDYSIHDGVLTVYPKERNGEQISFPLQTLVYFEVRIRKERFYGK